MRVRILLLYVFTSQLTGRLLTCAPASGLVQRARGHDLRGAHEPALLGALLGKPLCAVFVCLLLLFLSASSHR